MKANLTPRPKSASGKSASARVADVKPLPDGKNASMAMDPQAADKEAKALPASAAKPMRPKFEGPKPTMLRQDAPSLPKEPAAVVDKVYDLEIVGRQILQRCVARTVTTAARLLQTGPWVQTASWAEFSLINQQYVVESIGDLMAMGLALSEISQRYTQQSRKPTLR